MLANNGHSKSLCEYASLAMRLCWSGDSIMLIEDTGIYNTRNFASAEVFALRGPICLGYVVQPSGAKVAAVWLAKNGTRIGGPIHEDLILFMRRGVPRKIRST
jgi:hypothetical protein